MELSKNKSNTVPKPDSDLSKDSKPEVLPSNALDSSVSKTQGGTLTLPKVNESFLPKPTKVKPSPSPKPTSVSKPPRTSSPILEEHTVDKGFEENKKEEIEDILAGDFPKVEKPEDRLKASSVDPIGTKRDTFLNHTLDELDKPTVEEKSSDSNAVKPTGGMNSINMTLPADTNSSVSSSSKSLWIIGLIAALLVVVAAVFYLTTNGLRFNNGTDANPTVDSELVPTTNTTEEVVTPSVSIEAKNLFKDLNSVE